MSKTPFSHCEGVETSPPLPFWGLALTKREPRAWSFSAARWVPRGAERKGVVAPDLPTVSFPPPSVALLPPRAGRPHAVKPFLVDRHFRSLTERGWRIVICDTRPSTISYPERLSHMPKEEIMPLDPIRSSHWGTLYTNPATAFATDNDLTFTTITATGGQTRSKHVIFKPLPLPLPVPGYRERFMTSDRAAHSAALSGRSRGIAQGANSNTSHRHQSNARASSGSALGRP